MVSIWARCLRPGVSTKANAGPRTSTAMERSTALTLEHCLPAGAATGASRSPSETPDQFPECRTESAYHTVQKTHPPLPAFQEWWMCSVHDTTDRLVWVAACLGAPHHPPSFQSSLFATEPAFTCLGARGSGRVRSARPEVPSRSGSRRSHPPATRGAGTCARSVPGGGGTPRRRTLAFRSPGA